MPLFGKNTDEKSTSGMKRFDLGLAFGAGVTISKHDYIGIQSNLELMTLTIKDAENWGDRTKIHAGNLMIQVAPFCIFRRPCVSASAATSRRSSKSGSRARGRNRKSGASRRPRMQTRAAAG